MQKNSFKAFISKLPCIGVLFCFLAGEIYAQEIQTLPQIDFIYRIMHKSDDFSRVKLKELKQIESCWINHEEHTRRRYEINAPWFFMQVLNNNSVGEAATVNLPHRFSISDGPAGWYVQNIEIDKPEKGKRYFLMMEQVRMLCVVFVNGKEITRHLGGYTPFEADITGALNKGVNTIALYVHNPTISFDYEKGTLLNQVGVVARPNEAILRSGPWLAGGIPGEIYLEKRREVFVRETAIVTSVEKKELTVEITLENLSGKNFKGMAKAEVLSWPEGKKLIDLEPFSFSIAPGDTKSEVKVTSWKDPPLWSPDNPNLCILRVTLTGKTPDIYEERFGFREFIVKGKRFYLNGIPIKLRGPSQFVPGVNYLGRDQTFEYCKNVFACEKRLLDFNAYRTHAVIFPRVVFEAADEAGVLMINQSSIWSSMRRYYEKAGEEFMKNTRVEFAGWIKRDRNSPSVVIWDVENEMVRQGGELGFWRQLHDFVLEHDTSRVIIHSGSGDNVDDRLSVNHVHMGEAYTNQLIRWKEQSKGPVIFGEYWLGSPGEHRLTSSREVSTFDDYILEYARLFNEKTLEMRYYDAPGIMPFAVHRERLYYKNSITDLSIPGAICEEATDNRKNLEIMRHGIASVTAFFWPRTESADSKGIFNSAVIVCNDSEVPREFELRFKFDGQNQTPDGSETPFLLNPGERKTFNISLPVKTFTSTARAELISEGEIISSDELSVRGLSSLPSAPSLKRSVYLFGENEDAKIISSLGITVNTGSKLPDPDGSIVIFGRNYEENEELGVENIQMFIERGGAVLCLNQERLPDWVPVHLEFWSSSRGAFATYAPIYASDHQIFSGIEGKDLRWWDRTSGKILDMAFVRPGAVRKNSKGAWRALAGASRFENISVAEMRHGKGSVILSQLHLLENIDLAEPRQVFINMLSYLDKGGWGSGHSVKLSGSVNKSFFTDILGVKDSAFSYPDPQLGDLLIAGNNADMEEILNWADNGGRVIVLSKDMVSRFPGYTLSSDNNYRIGVRESDHPLLWGISSINFSENREPLVKNSFTKWPADARVLFQSLRAQNPQNSSQMTLSILGVLMFPVENGFPVIISQKNGKGEILLMPFEINEKSPFCQELVSTIIANAGVEIRIEDSRKLLALVKKTNPPVIDGHLDDWTEDLEDRNVTPYIHAEPVVLQAKNASGIKPESDLNFSGIVYFMWDDINLYLAGVAFGDQQNKKLELTIGKNKVSIVLKKEIAITINEQVKPEIQLASGTINDLNEFDDARLLSFTMINRRFGNLERVTNVSNSIFETAIPWKTLNLSPEQELIDLSITLTSEDYKIVLPAEADKGSLIIDKNPGKTR
jgi:hypothetical protein